MRADIIADYVSRHSPYSPSPDYYQNLLSLAVELRFERCSFLDVEPDAVLAEHYVYIYLDPRKTGDYKYVCPSGKVVIFKHRPFYVGKGKGRRIEAHLKSKQLARKSHKSNTIRAIQSAGLTPQVWITKSRASDYMAQALEIDLIAGIGRRDLKTGPLTNLTAGGDGSSGFVRTEEQNRKTSEKNKGRVRNAAALALSVRTRRARGSYTVSDATKERMRAAALNRAPRPALKPYTCPHCSTKGHGSGMLRWHFNNCRKKG